MSSDDSEVKRRKLDSDSQSGVTSDELKCKSPATTSEGGDEGEDQEVEEEDSPYWIPPSVAAVAKPNYFILSTFHSDIPRVISDNPKESVILGVDEAGRGPVLGPMVYGVAYALETYSSCLNKRYGFADSKTLKEEKRESLFKDIVDPNHDLHANAGWAVRTMTARDISAGMLQSGNGQGPGMYNLNEQAHDATIRLIREVIEKGVNLTHIYVDTVGPPASYQLKLKSHFPTVDITVAKKADSIYPIVSTASVVAKVTRDKNLHYHRDNTLKVLDIGSGYPSDPNTVRFFNSNVDKVFGWSFGMTRFLWQTTKDALVRNGAAEVIYESQCKRDPGYADVSTMFAKPKEDTSLLDKSYYVSSQVLL